MPDSRTDAVWVPAGTFRMGSNRHYGPVTNREFQDFVEATGYVTYAEIPPDAKDYPGALPEMLQPASLVFTPPGRPVDTSTSHVGFRLVRHASGP
jgi:formylglycine-generating enzyme required for sulfatase activity